MCKGYGVQASLTPTQYNYKYSKKLTSDGELKYINAFNYMYIQDS